MLGFLIPNTDFIQTEETQHKRYLGVIFDNKSILIKTFMKCPKSYKCVKVISLQLPCVF